jgi:ribonuclease T2
VVRKLVLHAAVGFVSVALLAVGASAQDRRQNEPGRFDFYVLSLSWSPSFCEAAAERSAERTARDPQCAPRRFSFVVHGLWPQYENGFPEYCRTPAPRLNRDIVSSMLDLMPSPRLVFRQWDRHGVCSGLPPRAYFDTVRKARALVKIPRQYLDVNATLTVTPEEVEKAFLEANPGLTRAGVAVACNGKRLSEVKICLTRELGFRACGEVDRRACRRDRLVMPPARGG